MSRESALDALLAEATPTFRVVLRRAYELGYREAVAEAPSRGPLAGDRPPDNARVPEDDPEHPDAVREPAQGMQRLVSDATPSNPPPNTSPRLLRWDQDSVDDDDDDNADGRALDSSRRHRRRVGIRASSTIGALKSKIQRRFRLDRFDIDIVIVRAGDKSRRQLPSHVTLGAYAREE